MATPNDLLLGDSQATEIVRYLPEDLVIQILSRLPAKSLCRFLCVSKLWSSLIYKFRILHPMSGLFIDRLEEFWPCYQEYWVPVTPEPHEPEWKQHLLCASRPDKRVIHSCNGLLLLNGYDSLTESEYYVFSVATMQYARIDANKTDFFEFGKWHYPKGKPLSRSRDRGACFTPCFLAYDPCKSPHYKVVRFTSEDKSTIVQIYSSRRRSWAKLTLPQESPRLCPLNWVQMAAFHKGALYMFYNHDVPYIDTNDPSFEDHLVRFDIERGCFDSVKLPVKSHISPRDDCDRCMGTVGPIRNGHHFASCIGESGGHLYYGVHTCLLSKLQVYMLDEHDFKKWRLVHNITTQLLDHKDYYLFYRPIAFHPESQVIYFSGKGIYSYDINKSSLEELCKLSNEEEEAGALWVDVFPVIRYIEPMNDFSI